jgi:hypothetical protein
MAMHTKVSGVWKEITGAHVKVAGSWKEITEGWVRVSGVWKQFYNASYLLDPGTLNFSHTVVGSTATNGIQIDTDRNIYEIAGSHIDRSDWLAAGGAASDYEVEFHFNSGTRDGGDSEDTYLALTSDRSVWIATETIETDTAQVRVRIRHATNTSDSIEFLVNLSATEDL